MINNTGRCKIIAEAGVNHNGQLDLAYQLCDAAKRSGADVIKFQTWDTDCLITKNVAMAEYQKDNTNQIESQYDMLKRLELTRDQFREIKGYCDRIGIVFASTADEMDSLKFLVSIGVPFIKVGSGDIGNIPYLRFIGEKGMPVIMSTGMCSLGDVELSISALREGGATDISLLHCTTNYPCPYGEVNLNAITTLRNAFGLPVGLSDHTLGTEIAVAAVAMGATIIEKHLTLDRNMIGPDHVASTEPKDFKAMVDQIRNVELGMGDGIKQITASEKRIKPAVTKRIVALKSINKGEVFSANNITVKRNDTGLYARYWDMIIGKYSDKSYEKDQGIVLW